MTVPQPLRDPGENSARAVQRISAGVQGGRRTGLAPVHRGKGRPRAAPPTPAKATLIPEGWVTYRQLSQSLSAGTLLDTPTLYDFEGDYSWLDDQTSVDGTWGITAPGLYNIHFYAAASSTRLAGNCVRLAPTGGSDFPVTTWINAPFLAASLAATGSLIEAAGVFSKVFTQDEVDTGPVYFGYQYLGAAATISSYLTFVRVIAPTE